ncbi:MAG: OsmC family protein [SAR324 cluster bacterium]|nr:OsmC family protein [SAR324 cluster bacterium]
MNPGELVTTVEGDIEKVDRTMKITEIRVHYKCPVPEDQKETVERVMEVHPVGCPAHQSIKDAIRVKIDAQFDWR